MRWRRASGFEHRATFHEALWDFLQNQTTNGVGHGPIRTAVQAGLGLLVKVYPCEAHASSMYRRGCTGQQLGTFACSYGFLLRRIYPCSTDGLEAVIPSSNGMF